MPRFATAILLAFCFSLFAADEPKSDTPKSADPFANHETRVLEGWTIHINKKLLDEKEQENTGKALKDVAEHLKNIVKVVPAEAVTELQKIHLWFNPPYPGRGPVAEYHPDAGWLKANKRNPAMAKGVEFTNTHMFEADTRRMPVYVLHELSHGYHDRYLSFERPDIVAAYKKAKESKSYDRVERFHGVLGKPNTFEKAYAMTDHKEYFAECSEAFFGRNDFFPFTREELEKHDPTIFKILQEVWKMPVSKQEK